MTSIASAEKNLLFYHRILLLVAGLGGLLYRIDVGIIGGALPYLEATSNLTGSQLSIIVAAVLLGSVFSTLFAGLLADWMGRKPLMIVSGIAFVISIPVIALSQGYASLFFGRLLQGCSGGLVGIVVPLYLAECLSARQRGRGTGIFQWLLTLGIFVAALIGIYYSYHVAEVARTASAADLFAVKDHAWRRIFLDVDAMGILFVLGGFFVSESPRWLFSKGRSAAALAALRRSRTEEQAAIEMGEMEQIARETAQSRSAGGQGAKKDSLLQRRYILPFLLACVILSCNTATGINSVIGFNTNILLQSGLSDLGAHWGYVVFTFCNFALTIVGATLGSQAASSTVHDRNWDHHRAPCPARCLSIPKESLPRRCHAGPWRDDAHLSYDASASCWSRQNTMAAFLSGGDHSPRRSTGPSGPLL
jgi:MFS family permease